MGCAPPCCRCCAFHAAIFAFRCALGTSWSADSGCLLKGSVFEDSRCRSMLERSMLISSPPALRAGRRTNFVCRFDHISRANAN